MARPRKVADINDHKRPPGWTIPDAPREIRRLAAAQAKANGLNLHEFITRAVLCALDHGDFMDGKYDPASMTSKSFMNDKPEKVDMAAVIDRLARLEAQIFAPPPPAGAAPTSRANPPGDVINVPPEPGQVDEPLPLPVPAAKRSGLTDEQRAWRKAPGYRDLNDAGRTELARRLAAGESTADIATAMGLTRAGVNKWKGRLAAGETAAGGDPPPGDAPESPSGEA